MRQFLLGCASLILLLAAGRTYYGADLRRVSRRQRRSNRTQSTILLTHLSNWIE